MRTFQFSNSQFASPRGLEPLSSVSIDGGLIGGINVEDGGEVAFENCTVFPGFIDVHNHGAVGVDVNSAAADDLVKVARFLALHGVTSWMPTLVPDSDETYRRVVDAIEELMSAQRGEPIAQAVGVHYEGVFANHAMCGALRTEFFRDAREPIDLPRLSSGVHMTTLAPEIDGGVDLIKRLVNEGWIVSIGHTHADRGTLDAAFNAGARHLTHFFNAMTGIHHRDLGVAGWGLAKEEVTFDIIADGIHVAPEMLRLAISSKSPQAVSLISDSIAPTSLGDGRFAVWDETIRVENGRTQNHRGSIAGSVCTMFDCVRNIRELGFSESEISLMASTNPAALLGLNDRGLIDIGRRADLVGLDKEGKLSFAVIGGEIVAPAHTR